MKKIKQCSVSKKFGKYFTFSNKLAARIWHTKWKQGKQRCGKIISPMCSSYMIPFRSAERIQRARCKRERRGLLRAIQAANFQGLEINFGKSLLVNFIRPLRRWSIRCYVAPWTLRLWGNFPPSRQPWPPPLFVK